MGGQDAHPSTQDAQTAPEPQIIITPQVKRGLVIDALRQFVGDAVQVEVIDAAAEPLTETQLEEPLLDEIRVDETLLDEMLVDDPLLEEPLPEPLPVPLPEPASLIEASPQCQPCMDPISEPVQFDLPTLLVTPSLQASVAETVVLEEVVLPALSMAESHSEPVPVAVPDPLPPAIHEPVVAVVPEPSPQRSLVAKAIGRQKIDREPPGLPVMPTTVPAAHPEVEIAFPLSNSEKSESPQAPKPPVTVARVSSVLAAPLPSTAVVPDHTLIESHVKKRPVFQWFAMDWLGRLIQHPLLHMLAGIGGALLILLWLLGD